MSFTGHAAQSQMSLSHSTDTRDRVDEDDRHVLTRGRDAGATQALRPSILLPLGLDQLSLQLADSPVLNF